MSDLAEQIDALLAINATGKASHPVPGLAVELLEKAAYALRYKPASNASEIEQEQEPVAWRWRVIPGGWNYAGHPAIIPRGATIEPLYLSPSVCEGKVTEEMVERARRAAWEANGRSAFGTVSPHVMRVALTAALSQD